MLIGDENCCFICGTTLNLQTHHCIGGSYRKLSDKYGLTVKVCANCHTGNVDSIHRENTCKTKRLVEKVGQVWAMEHYNWSVEDFRRVFGKNFL